MTVPLREALLLNDVQVGITRFLGRWGDETYLSRLRSALERARRVGIPVVHVRASFRPGMPEVSVRNRQLRAFAEKELCVEGAPDTEIDPEVEPLTDELVVTKKRVSAFAGSDLDLVLRAQGIESLAVAGIATSGAVLSTVRAAVDLDYAVTVLADGCIDPDPEVHRLLVEKVFARQADVLTINDWVTRPG